MKNLVLILLLCLLSCSKDTNQKPICCMNYNVWLSIVLRDQHGADLLSPDVRHSYKHEGIKLYGYDEHNKKVLLEENLVRTRDDFPFYLYISEIGGGFSKVIDLFDEAAEEGRHRIAFKALLELDKNTVDTLKIELLSNSTVSYIVTYAVWYNGEKVWERRKNKMPIKIVKQIG